MPSSHIGAAWLLFRWRVDMSGLVGAGILFPLIRA